MINDRDRRGETNKPLVVRFTLPGKRGENHGLFANYLIVRKRRWLFLASPVLMLLLSPLAVLAAVLNNAAEIQWRLRRVSYTKNKKTAPSPYKSTSVSAMESKEK